MAHRQCDSAASLVIKTENDCRNGRPHVSAGASLNEAPELQQLPPPSIFGDLFSRHPSKQRPSSPPLSTKFMCICVWALSSLTLPLRQRIRPFTTDLSLPIRPFHGPLYTVRVPPFTPIGPLWSGSSGVVCAGCLKWQGNINCLIFWLVIIQCYQCDRLSRLTVSS